jgi:hypothetical protein
MRTPWLSKIVGVAAILVVGHATLADISPSVSSLLALAQQTNQANLNLIQTWSGNAKISDTLIRGDPKGGANTEIHIESTVAFAVDTVHGMKRWQWIVTDATWGPQGGASRPMPGQIRTTDEMVRPDGYFNLSNGFLPIGSHTWQRTLVIWPLSRQPETQFFPIDHTFVPFDFMYLQGKSVSAYIDEMRPHWSKMVHFTLAGTRTGGIVQIRGISDTSHKVLDCWSLDLTRGGNLVQYFCDGDSYPETVRIDYTNTSGIWIPVTYSFDNPTFHRVVHFLESHLNQHFSPDEFTIARMGVQIGTRVTDQRTGVFYKYGDEAHALKFSGDSQPPVKAQPSTIRSHVNLASVTDYRTASDGVQTAPILIAGVGLVAASCLAVLWVRRSNRKSTHN